MKKAVLVCQMLLGVAVMAQQQPLQSLLVDIDHRPSLSLNGDWHYLVDQYGRGLYTLDGKIRNDGYAMNAHPVMVGERKGFDEYDFSTAPVIKVPGDWNTQDPSLLHYEGVVWYEKDFDFTASADRRTFLHVGAANYSSHVWVNTQRICDHEGGYTPFDCEVTAALKPGRNFVVIAVDGTRIADGIPGPITDWLSYSGITRDVSLVSVPKAFVDDFDLHLQKGTRDTITGYVHVEGAEAGAAVSVRIPELGLAASDKTDAEGRVAVTLKSPKLSLWEPGNPKLYRIEFAAGSDHLEDEIGFREVRVDGTKILLNGKPIFLRGVNAQAEAPYRTGRVSTQQDVDAIFGFLKDLNANFVRLAHYPHDEKMERTADRQGVLIWSEIPVWQRVAFEKPDTFGRAQAMLHEMIRRDRDKASVIFWSVANETPKIPVRTEFLSKLVAETRHLDSTRLVTAALNAATFNGNTATMEDPLVDLLDVVGINEYVGWYRGSADEAENIQWKLQQKPFIISEFGAEAKQGVHGATNQRWAEEQQAYVLEKNIAMYAKVPQIRGLAPWILMDFRSPSRNIPVLQSGFNRKGLISETGTKKAGFFVVKKHYEDGSAGKPE